MLIDALRQFRNRVASTTRTRRRRKSQTRPSAEVLETRALLSAVTFTAEEQLLVELVNRARANPTAEAALHGIGLNDGITGTQITTTPKQPLAGNQILADVTDLHSQDMIDRDFFAHVNPDGHDWNDRASAGGYPLSVAENLGIRASTGTIDTTAETITMHQGLFVSPLHRVNLLNDDAVEIGVGLKTGQFTDNEDLFGLGAGEVYNALLGTQNFAQPDVTYITGVAYHDDIVDDDFYTVGEGHASGTITVVSVFGETSAAINSVGGYQIAVPAGQYFVRFDDGTNTYISDFVEVNDQNVKVDFETTTAPLEIGLDLSFAATTVAENDQVVTGTVNRTGDLSSDYEVSLFTESGDIAIPISVVIPAGNTSADFSITSIDNGTLDGTREANIFLDAPFSIPEADSILVTDYEESITVDGTTGNDVFVYVHELSPTFHELTINGETFEFEGDNIAITFNGFEGADTVDIEATSGNDTIVLHPSQASVIGPGLSLATSTVEVIRVDGHTGVDSATLHDTQLDDDVVVLKPHESWLSGTGGIYNYVTNVETTNGQSSGDPGDKVQIYDSPGDDLLTGFELDTTLTGPGFTLYANGFATVDAYSTAGGNDDAQLTDSSHDDVYTGTPTLGSLVIPGTTINVHHYPRVELLGTSGGTDVAYLHDSAGVDTFNAQGTYSELFSTDYIHEINGFETVVAYSNAGGDDIANFSDTFGDDTVILKHNATYMSGIDIYNYAANFEVVTATSTAGSDSAQIYDSPGVDTLVSRETFSTLTGPGFSTRANGFDTVAGYSTLGGDDILQVHDSAGDDILVSRYDYTYIIRPTGTTYSYNAGFATTSAFATEGNDSVQFYDSPSDDFYITKPTYAYMQLGDGTYNYAQGFDSTVAYSIFGGSDEAQIYDSAGNDALEANNVWAGITHGSGVSHRATYFGLVRAFSTLGGNDTLDVLGALSFTLDASGAWM